MHRLYLVPTLLINVVIILIPALLTMALAFCPWDGIPLRPSSGSTPPWRCPKTACSDRAHQQHHLDGDLPVVPIGMGLLAAAMLPGAARRNFFRSFTSCRSSSPRRSRLASGKA